MLVLTWYMSVKVELSTTVSGTWTTVISTSLTLTAAEASRVSEGVTALFFSTRNTPSAHTCSRVERRKVVSIEAGIKQGASAY